MALTEKLTNIADAIRTKTGSADKLTLDGMATAIAGIQTGGGSGGGTSGIYMAKVTLAENAHSFEIVHNLGTTDILLAAVWAETKGDFVPDVSGTLAKWWAKTDINTRRGGNGFCPGYSWNLTNSYADSQAPNISSYESLTITENSVTFPKASSSSTGYVYYAGITYTVIIMAASAFSVTEV